MLRSHVDHLTITAPSLASGLEYVRQALGVTPQAGGEHPRMGTHNLLLKLGDSVFLEVISVNPEAPSPNRPRWYELDRPDLNSGPRLATWVVRTNDIGAAAAASPVSMGSIEPMSRGQLNWHITIPADGSLPLQGIVPTLIQWDSNPHPASTLQNQGCSLVKLEGFHSEVDRVFGMLRSVGFRDGFSIFFLPQGKRPYLIAHIQTPAGLRKLGVPPPP